MPPTAAESSGVRHRRGEGPSARPSACLLRAAPAVLVAPAAARQPTLNANVVSESGEKKSGRRKNNVDARALWSMVSFTRAHQPTKINSIKPQKDEEQCEP